MTEREQKFCSWILTGLQTVLARASNNLTNQQTEKVSVCVGFDVKIMEYCFRESVR
jgi:hypothetical protein